MNDTYVYGKHHLTDVHIFSDGSIWGVGYDGQDPRRMFHSMDSGNRWEVITVPSEGWVLNSICFIEDRHGWAAGNNGTVLNTHDQGATWVNENIGTSINLTTINFFDPNIGILGGVISRTDKKTMSSTQYNAKLFITRDGGKHWTISYEDHKSEVVKVIALSEKVYIAWLSAIGIIKTVDGGNSWQMVLPYQSRIVDIVFTSDKIGFALSDTGEIHKTDNQGSNWEKTMNLSPPSTDSFWWGIDFTDSIHGIAVGDFGKYASTFDGGKSWVLSKLNESDDLKVVRLNKKNGIIIGSHKIYSITGFQ